jgi:lysophospholipase L1-like esterase
MHHTINAGISGQTARQCLARFDRDVALYQPHVVIITVGGNDCNPVNNVSLDQFGKDLTEVVSRSTALGECVAILQTYYSFDMDAMPPDEQGRAAQFPQYMQTVRDVAAAMRSPLIDHLTRWERLRKTDVETYRELMRDPMHLSPLGNMVFGLDLIRFFGADVFDEIRDNCSEGLALQQQLDALEQAASAIH